MSYYNNRSYRGTRISSSASFRGQRRPSLVLPPDRNIHDGLILSSPVETLSVPGVQPASSRTDIDNVEYVGSYNWTDDKQPTIIVPGSPPEWTDRSFPFTLQPDTGLRFVDQNGHRMPTMPLLPLMKAADEAGTTVDWPSIDVVTDRNGLRKLARWIDKGASARDFRIDIELGGDRTLIMSRWEPNTRDSAGNGRSFGFGFEEATTRHAQGCGKSTGHYRITKYDFFGLSLIVRYEVDACLPGKAPANAKGNNASQPAAPASSNVDDLTSTLASVSVSQQQSPTTGASSSSLNIIHAGRQVPQSSVIELTTRSQNYIHLLDWSDVFPQLYLSQTPLFYLGVHQRGEFKEIRKQDMGKDMDEQREAALETFQRLGKVLEEIQELMVEHADKKLSLVCEGGVLKVYQRATTRSCLPQDVMERYPLCRHPRKISHGIEVARSRRELSAWEKLVAGGTVESKSASSGWRNLGETERSAARALIIHAADLVKRCGENRVVSHTGLGGLRCLLDPARILGQGGIDEEDAG
ncbi:hypothetical protein DENSPDRAFT_850802 [Dentipellis sp. KUC8613]|nr:hypothetical protein DENSPDRAFT_850802 [Dentipellis sp. KUC8613]